MTGSQQIGVLFVCLGNICRSPTAEGVFRGLADAAGLLERLRIDSAGVMDYHAGSPPDRRAQEHAARRGYDLSALRARRAVADDFDRFDFVLAMDRENHRDLLRICPPSRRDRLHLFLDFARDTTVREVPDPYYGGADGFEQVLDLVENASRGLLEVVRERLGG